MQIRAHAKLNLCLSVGPPIPGGRPGAGYHPIASWMTPISLADDIAIERTPGDAPAPCAIRWAGGSSVEWPIERDLAVRAHRALEDRAGRTLPIALEITKRIPAGGGLGGGSSDAAAVLRAVPALFELDIDEDALLEIARSLGSDVPFFLDFQRCLGQPPRSAIVTGLGERVGRLDTHPASDRDVALLFPTFGCPTRDVYQAFDHAPSPLDEAAARALARGATLDPRALFNDLAEPAMRVEPALRELRQAAEQRLAAPVHVSGSGSTLFVFPPPDVDVESELRDLDIRAATVRILS